jgi:hypothetical protein
MDVSSFVIRIVILAIPGIVASRVYRALQGEAKGRDWESFIEIALFAVASYALYELGASAFGKTVMSLHAVLDEKIPLSWNEISIAAAISLPLAYIASLLSQKKIFNRVGQQLRVTERFGGESVWSLFLALPEVQDWIYVRDHKLGITYFGYVVAYSGQEEKEIIMKEVEVFDSERSKLLYKRNMIYIARSRNELSIEVPDIPANGLSSAR